MEVEAPDEYTKRPLWGRYPCQEALAKIGKPSEWRLIEILSRTEREEVKAAALKVIQDIEGWRGAVFARLLQNFSRRRGSQAALSRAFL